MIDYCIKYFIKSNVFVLCLLISFLLGGIVTSNAQSSLQSIGQEVPRNALVIGNSDYQFTSKLVNATNDSKLIAATLRKLSFNVTLLEDVNHQEFTKGLLRFNQSLPEGGVVLVYFAGHGVQVNGKNYLIPVDASVEQKIDLPLISVPSDLMLSMFAKKNSLANIFIFDACRNNPFEEEGTRGSGSERGLAPISVDFTGNLIAYATAPGRVAFDGENENSPFTTALSQSLLSPGLSIESVLKLTRSKVIKETNYKQVPWENSSLTRDVFLTPKQGEEKEPLTQCDRLAGHPSDPERVFAGVDYPLLKPSVAIPICRADLANDPVNPRLMSLLARALDKAGEYEEAIELNNQAIELDYLGAYHNLGNHYKKGNGVKRDLDKALELFLYAGERGHPEDAYNSGNIFRSGTETKKPDLKLALKWFERAADQNYPSAFDKLGLAYLKGQGVELNSEKATEYFESGAQLGDASAMTNLGTLYRKGEVVGQDFTKARKLFLQAAQLRRRAAYVNLGILYAKGQGVEASAQQAAFWFGLGARSNHKYSREQFEELTKTFDEQQLNDLNQQMDDWVSGNFG